MMTVFKGGEDSAESVSGDLITYGFLEYLPRHDKISKIIGSRYHPKKCHCGRRVQRGTIGREGWVFESKTIS